MRRTWLLCAVLGALWLAGCAAQPPGPAATPGVLFPGLKVLPELKSRAFDTSIELSWTAVPGAATYNLYWSEKPGAPRRTGARIAGLKTTTYRHTGLEPGHTYYYAVTAVDSHGVESAPLGQTYDVPFHYAVRRFAGFLGVVPRLWDTFGSLAAEYLGDAEKGWLIQDFNGVDRVTPFKALLIPRHGYDRGGLEPHRYKTVPVLVYHHLSLTRSSRMTVSRSDFELQMAYLKHNRYQVIPLDQLVRFLEFRGGVPDRAVVITFDDGWASTYRLAYPILKRYGFPATLFVYTDFIGSGKDTLTWAQIRALQDTGLFDVQCHTRSHRNLRMKPSEDLRAYVAALENELVGAQKVLESRIGKTCRYLAYPYGATNHLVIALAQKAGYRAAFTVHRGPNPFFVDNYRVLRSMVYGNGDLKQFAANLTAFGNAESP